MNAVVLSDHDSRTEVSENLEAGLVRVLREDGHHIRSVGLEKDHVAPCLGCFLCATTHRGECVTKDAVGDIRRDVQTFGLTVFVTPVVFGHSSSTVRNAIDRGTGSRRWQVVIGYGNGIDAEEKSTFIDLTAKHRGSADIVRPGMDARVDVSVARSLEENAAICERVKRDLNAGWRA